MDFDLAIVLTTAGATVGAGVVSTVTEVLKHVPGLGTLVQRNAAGVAIILDGLLVAAAYANLTTIGGGAELVSIPGVVGAIVAWAGMSAISLKAYEVVAARRTS